MRSTLLDCFRQRDYFGGFNRFDRTRPKGGKNVRSHPTADGIDMTNALSFLPVLHPKGCDAGKGVGAGCVLSGLDSFALLHRVLHFSEQLAGASVTFPRQREQNFGESAKGCCLLFPSVAVGCAPLLGPQTV